jgi:hypothetical protein
MMASLSEKVRRAGAAAEQPLCDGVGTCAETWVVLLQIDALN